MSKLKLPKNVAEHFFGKAAVEAGLIASLPTVQTKPFHPNLKMKIKFWDPKTQTHATATVVDVEKDDMLRIVVDGANAAVVHVIEAKNVSGLYITSMGREVELSFGVGRVSSTSLVDEGY